MRPLAQGRPYNGQFPTERVQMPLMQMFTALVFINRQVLPDANFVAGGLQTPTTTKIYQGDMVYLLGSGYTTGASMRSSRAA